MSSEHAVREAATQLQAAITAAEKDGYRIGWPSSAAGLAAIAISETGKVAQVVTELVIDTDTSGADRFSKPMDKASAAKRGSSLTSNKSPI